MSQINNITPATPIQKITQTPIQKEIATDAPPSMRAVDKLELSGATSFLSALKSNEIRTDKVAEIRQQIQAGTYDAQGAKLDGAVDKLLDELNS
jgi:anti-sigma28 factor (negative regulator of flagellin synthesis)